MTSYESNRKVAKNRSNSVIYDENNYEVDMESGKLASGKAPKRQFIEISNKCELLPKRMPKLQSRTFSRALQRATLVSTPVDLDSGISTALASAKQLKRELNDSTASSSGPRKSWPSWLLMPKSRTPMSPALVLKSQDESIATLEYTNEVLCYLKERAQRFQVNLYLERHHLTATNRAAIVDWIIQMETQAVNPSNEKLYLAVKIFDIFLSLVVGRIPKTQLQLVGIVALVLAHKYDGCDSVINLKDFNELYSVPDLVAMEKKVLQTIGFELGIPIAWDFLQMFGKHLKLSPAIVTLAGNILRLTPNEYNFVAVDEGKKAAAALFIALRMTNQSGWNQIARYFTGYSPHDFQPEALALNGLINQQSNVNALNERNFCSLSSVALSNSIKLKLLTDVELFEENDFTSNDIFID